VIKNQTGSLTVFAFDAATNLPKTGDAANLLAYVKIDGGAVTVLSDITAVEEDANNAKGFYTFDLTAAETNGDLACRETTLGDLAVAAHLSSLDYFGEVPWNDFAAASEWYVRMKSRPSFRSILSDRVPGQPPVAHYAELDF